MGRTFVITGTASGIAAATSRILKEAGNKVIGIDIKDADIEADLSTRQGRLEAAKKAIELTGGSIDAVIACAGLAHPTATTVSVNYFGVTEFLNELLPTLTKSKTPRVVITSSVASIMPNSAELVEAMCANNEAKAVEIAQALVDAAAGGGGGGPIRGPRPSARKTNRGAAAPPRHRDHHVDRGRRPPHRGGAAAARGGPARARPRGGRVE